MEKVPFTHAQMLEMFGYDEATGNLLWKIRPSNRTSVGDVAGQIGGNGRRYIGIDGRRYLAHRLVWLHQKGEWPKGNIASGNGDYLDTRIGNLVEETAAQTAAKSVVRSTNKSGVKGVSWSSVKQVWMVHGYRDYQTVFLGQFKELEDAISCKRKADVGVFPTDAEVAAANKRGKRIGAQARRLWTNMMKASDGVHGWGSMDEFYSEVGDQPQTNYLLEKLNDEAPIGPGNYRWVPPKHDGRTREGRIGYQKEYNAGKRYRTAHLRKKYKISDAEYELKWEQQGGVCAICKKPESGTRNGKVRWLNVDHNHTTDAVRGLLCTNCNVAVGMMNEDRGLLQAAISYLDKWEP